MCSEDTGLKRKSGSGVSFLILQNFRTVSLQNKFLTLYIVADLDKIVLIHIRETKTGAIPFKADAPYYKQVATFLKIADTYSEVKNFLQFFLK